ncbi:hypothetical protein [Protaetiibacter larvae]|uniref:Uncharacterized protein n=1 Tax=Protaetiibacter larvae TaxID=2592654 RepID=A0A5C1Y9V0_9MICO|nr:hypothetical protein [Protaetiibacter larvae]QEO10015.1 hypothetical protein FLP23_08360 [Protaetiibacter larvae]
MAAEHRDRAMMAIRTIERHALRLATEPRRVAAERTLDLRIIERQLAALIFVAEVAATADQPSARPMSEPI